MLKNLGKIGKQVLFLETSLENCRNGEGAFARLKDDSILFAYTEFMKGSGRDEDEGRIAGYISRDERKTWSEGTRCYLSDSYCYPAIFAGEDYFLTAYYHSGGSGWRLSSTKVVKVRFDEMEG